MLIRDNVVTEGGDHGIVFTRGTTNSQIVHNLSAYNCTPLQRQATALTCSALRRT